MRTASLSTLTYDLEGHVRLRLHGTTAGETRRRVNRVATLDGGAVNNDMGYSASDLTLDLRWPATDPATDAAVQRLVQLYARLVVAVPGAVYLTAPESYTPGATESRLRLLVLGDLTA